MLSTTREERSENLVIEELQYDTPELDLSSPMCHRQLVLFLGLNRNARIEPLLGHAGGLNKGLWAVHGSSESLILKLVNSQRSHPMLPTETESFTKLAQQYPNLIHDRELAFPLKIFHCRRCGRNITHDLIVMRKASGESFSDLVSRKWKSGHVPELMNHFHAAGCFLARIHSRHGLQHGDFQPNNLFYDEATNQFTMIDIADLSPNSLMVTESDVDHFCRGVGLLASVLGVQLQIDGLRHFQAGYSKTRQ
jgi:serine/threonine protein kinase